MQRKTGNHNPVLSKSATGKLSSHDVSFHIPLSNRLVVKES